LGAVSEKGNEFSEPDTVSVEKVTVERTAYTEKVTTEKYTIEKSASDKNLSEKASAQNGNGTGVEKATNGSSFFDGVRFDYRMQPSGIVENLSEYAAIINAHKSYWYSKDVMLFVLQHL